MSICFSLSICIHISINKFHIPIFSEFASLESLLTPHYLMSLFILPPIAFCLTSCIVFIVMHDLIVCVFLIWVQHLVLAISTLSSEKLMTI